MPNSAHLLPPGTVPSYAIHQIRSLLTLAFFAGSQNNSQRVKDAQLATCLDDHFFRVTPRPWLCASQPLLFDTFTASDNGSSLTGHYVPRTYS
jgi:hypothetical protein